MKNHKLVLMLLGLFLAVGIVWAAQNNGGRAYPDSTGLGTIYGSAGSYISFYGNTPVVRPSITNTTPVLRTIYTYTVTAQTYTPAFILADGTTNTTAIATNVVISTVTTNTVAGFSTTNSFNQLINGLGDTSGLGLFDQQ